MVQVKMSQFKYEKQELGNTLKEVSRGIFNSSLKFSIYFRYKIWNIKVMREIFGKEFERLLKREVKGKVEN